jgi:DNA-directed RNA polymerase specialized sigma24 family protein
VAQRKIAWTLTQDGFDRLLSALHADRQRAGDEYQHLRLALVKFFQWRDAPAPADHADEVIDRVIRRLQEGEVIADLRNYCYGVARRVLAELTKRPAPAAIELETLPQAAPADDGEAERALACLERCLQAMPQADHTLIVEYHRQTGIAGIRARGALAEARGIPVNALRIRAHRIRKRLEACVRSCAGQGRRGDRMK